MLLRQSLILACWIVFVSLVASCESWSVGAPDNKGYARLWCGLFGIHIIMSWLRYEGYLLWATGVSILWFQWANLAFQSHFPEIDARIDYIASITLHWISVEFAWTLGYEVMRRLDWL